MIGCRRVPAGDVADESGGSVVRWLQLAHNERHLRTGSPVAKVIHNFGRADKVDRDALARLESSISRSTGIATHSG